jgi:hypothetical protein
VVNWLSDDACVVDGVTFVAAWPDMRRSQSTATRFCIQKPRYLIDSYVSMIEELRPRRVVELGIFDGGSTAFIAALASLEKLVAIDCVPQRCAALDDFVVARGLPVSSYFGVDQADTSRLDEIVADEFDGPLDVVIDDASHNLFESRLSFECLFPRLRPGGLYVLEDWGWAHFPAVWKFKPGQPALSILVFQAAVAACTRPDIVAGVSVTEGWTVIRRGDGSCENLELTSVVGELMTNLVDRMTEVRIPDRR